MVPRNVKQRASIVGHGPAVFADGLTLLVSSALSIPLLSSSLWELPRSSLKYCLNELFKKSKATNNDASGYQTYAILSQSVNTVTLSRGYRE